MTGFEPLISGVGSDRFTNCAITTALAKGLFTLAFSPDVFVGRFRHRYTCFSPPLLIVTKVS